MPARLVAGYSLSAVALGLVITVSVIPADPVRETLLGVAALVGGLGIALVLFFRAEHKIQDVNRPADEAYEAGHDDGYEKGWRDHARRALRVVNMEERRRKRDGTDGE